MANVSYIFLKYQKVQDPLIGLGVLQTLTYQPEHMSESYRVHEGTKKHAYVDAHVFGIQLCKRAQPFFTENSFFIYLFHQNLLFSSKTRAIKSGRSVGC